MLLAQYQHVRLRSLCQYSWFFSPSGWVKLIQFRQVGRSGLNILRFPSKRFSTSVSAITLPGLEGWENGGGLFCFCFFNSSFKPGDCPGEGHLKEWKKRKPSWTFPKLRQGTSGIAWTGRLQWKGGSESMATGPQTHPISDGTAVIKQCSQTI